MRHSRSALYFILISCAAFAWIAAKPLMNKKKIVVVALGDSLTAGTPYFRSPIEAPPKGQGDREGQYAHWMMRKKPEWNVINMGVAGETSSQIRARFQTAMEAGPRFIIVFAGTNDIAQSIPPQGAVDNLKWMYGEAKRLGILPVAVTLPPFNEMSDAQKQSLDLINKWIRKEADIQRIPLIDAYEAVRDPKNPYRLDGSADGWHPDIGGYRSIAKKAVEAIEPIEKIWR